MLNEIERLSLDDLAGCLDLAKDRGWVPRERIWRLLLEESQAFGVRDDEGNLAGSVVLSTYGGDLAAVGMMLVAARYEGRGIGRRLMEHVLSEAGDMPVCLYATGVGRPLYEKLGFVPIGIAHAHLGVFTTPTPAAPAAPVAPPEAAEAPVRVRPANADDLDAILDLDATVFGADRSMLLRRLPDFAAHLLVALDRTADNAGEAVVGFGAGWDGTSGTVIGPVIARTPAAAKLLIGELGTRAQGPVMLDLDDHRHDLRTWAEAHGLAARVTTTVMVYNTDQLPGDRSGFFAPLAKAVG